MPTIVTPEEQHRYQAKLVIGGGQYDSDAPYSPRKTQVPYLTTKKTVEKVSPRQLLTTFTLKLQYNNSGRRKAMYNEWPMRVIYSDYELRRFIKYNLAELMGRDDNIIAISADIPFKLFGDKEGDYGIYQRPPNTKGWLWEAHLIEYEGVIH